MIAQPPPFVKRGPRKERIMITNKLPDTDLRLSDFHYDLPGDRIAQTPAETVWEPPSL